MLVRCRHRYEMQQCNMFALSSLTELPLPLNMPPGNAHARFLRALLLESRARRRRTCQLSGNVICLGLLLALALSAAPADGDVVGCPSGAQEEACENDDYGDGSTRCCSSDGKCASGFEFQAGDQKCGGRLSGGAGAYKSTCCMGSSIPAPSSTSPPSPAATTTEVTATTTTPAPSPGPLSCAAGAYENHERSCVPCGMGKFHPYRITDCELTHSLEDPQREALLAKLESLWWGVSQKCERE